MERLPGRPSSLHIVINPAAGQEEPVLSQLNSALAGSGIDWEVSVTHGPGDARAMAEQAASDGFEAVAAYGGDGTVMEVADGLRGSRVPLAILPGRTANVMSLELGLPATLEEAISLLTTDRPACKSIDMGRVSDRHFLLRAGIGLEAEMVAGADRDLKDQLGSLAYLLSGLRAVQDPPQTEYRLELDGRVEQITGVTCLVTNAGNAGVPGLALAEGIDVSDGLLDVIVLRAADLKSLITVAAGFMLGKGEAEPLARWQAGQITVGADPAQITQLDGEVLGQTPLDVQVVQQAVRIFVPQEG